MTYLQNDQILACDVDDTLVLWRDAKPYEDTVEITDPYDGAKLNLVIHRPHIKLLRDRFARGCQILIWSQGGAPWARAVVEALGLQDIKPLIITKPFMVIDDLDTGHWMPKRTYLKDDIGYGNQPTSD